MVKLPANGEGAEWEGGNNRSAQLPPLSPLLARCSSVRVGCGGWGDTAGTLVHLDSDAEMLQARCAALCHAVPCCAMLCCAVCSGALVCRAMPWQGGAPLLALKLLLREELGEGRTEAAVRWPAHPALSLFCGAA